MAIRPYVDGCRTQPLWLPSSGQGQALPLQIPRNSTFDITFRQVLDTAGGCDLTVIQTHIVSGLRFAKDPTQHISPFSKEGNRARKPRSYAYPSTSKTCHSRLDWESSVFYLTRIYRVKNPCYPCHPCSINPTGNLRFPSPNPESRILIHHRHPIEIPFPNRALIPESVLHLH